MLTVVPHEGGWAVEHEGARFAPSPDKEIAKASAHKRAREFFDSGRACQVRVFGEQGFFGTR